MKLRRCQEDREDFTTKDNNIWPMYVNKGGVSFGFCPGKATWDSQTMHTYQMLVVAAETGNLWEAGGISNQPAWFVDLLAWFLPRYNDRIFYSRVKSILGDGETDKWQAKKI